MPPPDLPVLMVVSDRSAVHARFGAHEDGLLRSASALANGLSKANRGPIFFRLREKDLPRPDYCRLAMRLAEGLAGGPLRIILRPGMLEDGGGLSDAAWDQIVGFHRTISAFREQPEIMRRPDQIIGVSVHDADELGALTPRHADYAALGTVFPTPSHPEKDGEGDFLGADTACALAVGSDLPVFLIGGIDHENAPELVRRGARRLAVVRAVLSAEDPAESAMRFLDLLGGTSAASNE